MKFFTSRLGIASSALIFSTNLFAINGSFDNAYSEITRGMGGSGAALPQDAIITGVNPAGLIDVNSRFDAGAAFYFPDFKLTVTGSSNPAAPTDPLQMPVGTFENKYKLIFLPDIGYAKQIDEKSAWGISLYAVGGFGTEYNTTESALITVPVGPPTFPLVGLLGDGDYKSLLRIALLNGTYARRIYENETVNISGGVSILGAVQTYENKGAAGLAALSADSANLSGRGIDFNFGIGVRVALQLELYNKLNAVISYQPRIGMSKFSKYKGLFANSGELDIPANGLVAIAYHVNKDLALTADVQRIWYNDVNAYGNSGTCLLVAPPNSCQLGQANGPGFGWKNQNAYKVGVQWHTNEYLTLRAGANFADLIVSKDQMLENALTPGVTVKTLLSVGGTLKYNQNEINFFGVYIPNGSLKGINNFAPTIQTLDIKTTGFGFGLGYTRVFD